MSKNGFYKDLTRSSIYVSKFNVDELAKECHIRNTNLVLLSHFGDIKKYLLEKGRTIANNCTVQSNEVFHELCKFTEGWCFLYAAMERYMADPDYSDTPMDNLKLDELHKKFYFQEDCDLIERELSNYNLLLLDTDENFQCEIEDVECEIEEENFLSI